MWVSKGAQTHQEPRLQHQTSALFTRAPTWTHYKLVFFKASNSLSIRYLNSWIHLRGETSEMHSCKTTTKNCKRLSESKFQSGRGLHKRRCTGIFLRRNQCSFGFLSLWSSKVEMSTDRNDSTSNCAAVIQILLMHLNLCGKKVTQTHHQATLAEVETDCGLTCTFEKHLFLLQTWVTPWSSNWFGVRFKFILKITGLFIAEIIHTKEQLQTEKRPWWHACDAGLALSWSHHPSPHRTRPAAQPLAWLQTDREPA